MEPIINKKSKFKIIDSGVLLNYDAESPIEISVEFPGFQFTIQFIFKTDGQNNQSRFELNTDMQNNLFSIVLINFNNPLGTSFTNPISIGTYKGKRIWLRAWIYNISNQPSFKVDYCLFME